MKCRPTKARGIRDSIPERRTSTCRTTKSRAVDCPTTMDGSTCERIPMNVVLEWYEIDLASDVGRRRNVEAIRKKCVRSVVATDEWTSHILGALGELAFCKATGRYWCGSVNTFKGPDVGMSIQVRTRSKHTQDLIVRPKDGDSDVFVLVTGGPSEFMLHGWMLGKEAKQEKYLTNPGGYGTAYFVPASELHPMSKFPEGA